MDRSETLKFSQGVFRGRSLKWARDWVNATWYINVWSHLGHSSTSSSILVLVSSGQSYPKGCASRLWQESEGTTYPDSHHWTLYVSYLEIVATFRTSIAIFASEIYNKIARQLLRVLGWDFTNRSPIWEVFSWLSHSVDSGKIQMLASLYASGLTSNAWLTLTNWFLLFNFFVLVRTQDGISLWAGPDHKVVFLPPATKKPS